MCALLQLPKVQALVATVVLLLMLLLPLLVPNL
jgi:hypothetical protein